jgi:hypothetical protein
LGIVETGESVQNTKVVVILLSFVLVQTHPVSITPSEQL